MHHHSKPYEHLQLCVQQITHQFISKYCCNAVLCRCSAYVMTALECSTCSKEVCAPAGRCNDKTRVDQSEGFVSLCKCVLRVSMCFACPRWCLLGAQFTLDVAQRKRCRCWVRCRLNNNCNLGYCFGRKRAKQVNESVTNELEC